MEKGDTAVRADGANNKMSIEEFHAHLSEMLPFYFDKKYDDPIARRECRDGFLKYVIMRLLISTELKRKAPDDDGVYWTATELFIACWDLWCGIVGSAFIGEKESFLFPNPHFIQDRFMVFRVQYFGRDSKFHYIEGRGFDFATEDRIVPFNLEDVERVLNELITSGRCLSVKTSLAKRKCIFMSGMEQRIGIIQEKWLELHPKIEPTNPDELFKALFCDNGDSLPKQILHCLKAVAAITPECDENVPIAEFIVHGDPIYNRSLMSKSVGEYKSPEKSHYTVPVNDGSRTVFEPYPYGWPKSPEEDRKLTLRGMYVNGTKYVMDRVWKFLTDFPELVVLGSGERVGYCACETVCQLDAVLPVSTVELNHADEFGPGNNALELIQYMTRCSLEYEKIIDRMLSEIDEKRKKQKESKESEEPGK